MTSGQDDRAPMGFGPALREWFTGPPRAHGDQQTDRVVSFLELFYDLVYVVLIAQLAHTLAVDVSWVGLRNFVIVFGLIWIVWLNGTLYHELHGREDGRSRTFIFIQMGLLVVMAVYAGHAADTDGRPFAIVLAIILAVLTLQWFGVRRYDTAEVRPYVTRYVTSMLIVIALVIVSAVVDDEDIRLIIWSVIVAGTVIGRLAQYLTANDVMESITIVTESMAERFGLFTIIVLGEVVVGVADGLSEAERDTRTIVVGLLALNIGFGLWWNYFDFVGRRVPRQTGPARGLWMMAHLPLAGGIAAGGAGMVSLVEHAADDRTPAGTAWLIGGSTALMLLSLALLTLTIDAPDHRRAQPTVLVAAAVAALIAAAARPDPVILSLLLSLILVFVWMEAFSRLARTGERLVAS